MSKISTYEVTPVPKLADKLIGTSVGGEIEDITYNFTLSELLNLFIPNIPANTLQGVLDYGNEATQDIILNGTIFTTYLEVTDTATILNSYLTEETHIAGSLYDRLDSAGTAGQVLRSTGTQVEWYSIPNIIPTLQQVLAAGNTADINIILSSNIQAITATANNVVSNTSLSVNGTLKDKDASVGTSGQVLSSTGTKVQWINLPVYTATSPLSIDSITRVISIQQASASQNGYLSSADWITFDGKQGSISLTTTGSSGPATLVGSVINVPNYTLSGLGGVPQTRTLTINGVTYNLSADRSWTLATGVSSVSATTPLFSTGGVNPDISIQKSSSSLDGYLSSVDWLTFNSKQPAGNYITSLTGEATAAGPGAAAVTLSNAAVIGKLLTGLNIAGGTVVSTDSILTAFGKVQNQINSLVGGVIYKGVWNASTNTPTLVSSVGTQGNYYIVSVAGNTNLNGITDWNVGDWAIFNGSAWNKVDNTDAVTSVNGQTGAVSLTTDNIPEGATNLYYLNSRARAALSFAAGSGAYNSTTGVITIPTNNNQITNGANYIVLGSLSASSPLSYNNTTGAFAIQVANTTQNGYLSSTDWNTFNSKQAFLNGTGLVKSVAGVISYITDNSTNWNTAYDNMIVSAAVTGTSTKTLTLTQQDAGTITASWTDNGLTSVGVSMPSAFSVANSPLTSNGTIAITGAGSALQYIDGTGALQTFPTIANEAATLVTEVYNETGATLTKGTVVYINGGHGNLPTVTKALATSDATSAQTYGVVQVDITNMNNGHVVVIGSLGDLDTQAYANGTILYLSSTTAGAWTSVKQYAPAHLVYVGIVVRSHPTQGVVEIKIQNGYELDELHNVAAQSPSNGNILQYVSSTQLWTAVAGTTTNIAEGTNLYYLDSRARAALSFVAGSGAYNSTTGVITIPTNNNQITNGANYITLGSLSATAPLSYNNLTGAFSISQSGASTNGYLSSIDWNTFNDKQPFITAGTTLQYYRGDKTFQTLNTTAVPEGTNLYYTNARTIASTLTGYVSGAGTITSADSLLTAIQKLNGNIGGLTTGVSSVFGRTGAVIAVSGDYTTTLVPEGTNLYYLDSRARAAVSLTTTGSSGASTYNSTTGVFNIPNYGAALSGYVPTSRTLNINGTSYDLSADRSWSVGTVTSVAALTLGTTGTDLSSSVATGTTTPVITLNVPTASAANRGALSSADWSTFNAKVSGVTATSPLASSGGTTPNITIQQSSGSQAGYLSAADWTTFNNKQAAGNYITSLTGEATASGPGAASVTLSNSAVTGKVLTGINITGGTVVDTDSILTAFGKVQNQINGLVGGSIYKGTWNASTNVPALASGVGTRGWYYIVSVAGTTNLDGITDWFVGDWAIFDGTAWQQVDNTDAVVSVNGQTGAVSLTTDNIPEGSTNQYFLNSRARSALSFTAGSGAYNSTTGVITIPTNTSQLTNGANFITLASLSGTAPIVYSNTTGAISITQSGTASNGYLSSTDWNTFNNKQAALTNPVTGTGTANYLPKFTGASTIGNSIAYDGGSSIGINTNAPYDSTQFKLDINGGLLIKNASAVPAQITLINSNPATGGDNAFIVHSVGGTLTDSWAQLQTYYGTSVAGGGLRLQPSTGQILIGSTTVSAFKVDITGTLRLSGQLTLGSTITNGTYTYTLPGATGTLALTSQLTGGTVTSVAALTIGTTGTDLSSTVANSTTTPVITLNVPTASATNRGALSAADWTTFNSKAPSVAGGYLPLSGGTMTGPIGLVNNGIGIQVGDDATISDRNVANTMYVAGVQSTDRGYINFSETAGNQLGAINGGDLTWRGVPIITTSNVSGTVNYIPKFTAANSVGNSNLQTDTSGNLGLGVTPSAWSLFKVLQGVGGGSLGFRTNAIELINNATYDGTNFNYVNTGTGANRYNVSDGVYTWWNAPSGTANNAITFTTAMILDASGRLGIGVTPTQSLDVIGNGKFRGQDLLLGSSVAADNVIYIYSKNGAESQIRTNAGVSSSYNGMMIASNYNQANSLPSWSIDLGGALNSTSNVNSYTLGYRPYGGAWASLMTVSAAGDTVISNNVTAASAIFNNGTNSTNGIKIVSTTSSSAFTGGIEFIRTTVAGGSKIQPLRDTAIGGVGFNFLVTTNNAAEIAATYTSALQILNTGAATFSGSITTTNGNIYLGSTSARIGTDGVSSIDFNYNTGGTPVLNWYGGTTSTKFSVTSTGVGTFSDNIFIGAGKYLGYSASAYITPEDNVQGAKVKTPGGFLVESAGAVKLTNLAGTGTRMVVSDASGNLSTQAIGSGAITGSGTTNYVPKFTSSSAIGNSVIIDNGSDVSIGSTLRVNAYGNTAGGTIRMGVVNDSTSKWSYLVSTQYDSSVNSKGFSVIGAFTSSTANDVIIGGSIYEANPATSIQFWTYTATTHALGGIKRMQIDTNGIATFYYGSIFNAPMSINGGAVPSDRWFEVTGTTSGKVFGAVFNPTFTYTGANIYGIYVGNNFNTGTITNSYNLYIEGTSVGSATITNKYGLYQAGGADKNYFAGTSTFGFQTVATNSTINLDSVDPALRFRVSGGTAGRRIYDLRAIAAGGAFDYLQIRLWNDAQTSSSELFKLDYAGNLSVPGSIAAGTVLSWNGGVGSLSYNTGVVTMETNSATRIELKTNGTTALTLNTNQSARFANIVGIGKDPSYNLDVNGTMRGSDRLYWNGQSQLVYILNYDQIPNADTTTIADSTATNGYALRKSGGSSTFFYGNYTSFPPGNYTAYFRLKVASNASGSTLGQLDVVGANCIGFAITLRPNMFQASDTWQYIKLPFTITGGGYIEWRLVGWTGLTDTFYDHIMIYQEGGEGNVFTRNAYSIYVNQNTLGMQLNTSGALTVTSSVTATSFFESSDSRLKNLIQDNYKAIGIETIKPKLYIKDGREEVGYFAQDIQELLSSAVTKNDAGFLSLSYTQVHTAKIAIIEDEVTVLKNKVSELEYKLQKYEA